MMLWACDVCSRAAFAQPGPVSSVSLGRFFSVRVRLSETGFLASLEPPHLPLLGDIDPDQLIVMSCESTINIATCFGHTMSA